MVLVLRRRGLVQLFGALGLIASVIVAGPLGTGRGVAETPEPRATGPSPRSVGAKTGFAQGHTILWGSDAQLAADLDGMARSGAGWIRVDFDWPSIQSGGRDAWNWGPTDRVVLAAKARGLSVLAVPAYTPAWARAAGTNGHHPPTDVGDFARFVDEAARRYAPMGVHHWEIWNEPNLGEFWQPAPDPVAYARLLIAASNAIHAADADAFVMNGGLAPATDVFGDAMAPRNFLFVMYAQGAGPALDAVGMHPYSFPYAPMHHGDWNTFSTLPQTHAVMAHFGDGRKQIWATEAGFGTGRDEHSVNETVQALRVRQILDAWREFDFAGNIFFYTYRDLNPWSSLAFDRMGLVRADGSAKPALAVFKGVMDDTDVDRLVRRGLCGPAAHLAPAGTDACVETRVVARFVRARILAARG